MPQVIMIVSVDGIVYCGASDDQEMVTTLEISITLMTMPVGCFELSEDGDE